MYSIDCANPQNEFYTSYTTFSPLQTDKKKFENQFANGGEKWMTILVKRPTFLVKIDCG